MKRKMMEGRQERDEKNGEESPGNMGQKDGLQ